MRNNIFVRIITSMPIILLTLYFIPVLGVILALFRGLVYKNVTKYSSIFIFIGFILLIPALVDFIMGLFSISSKDIPYLSNIMSSKFYTNDLIDYSKLLITIGVLYIIVSLIARNALNRAGKSLNDYLKREDLKYQEIARENDMKIKLKQEKAKNTKVVYCPYCGADNILTESTGVCKYCRRNIKAK